VRLVLDANVLIAAFVARGVCAELLEHSVREHEPVTSAAILEEVRRNLVGKIKVTANQADQTVKLLRTRLEMVEPVAVGAQVCRDPDDDVVLGMAVAGRCDAIVTGDKDLLDLVRYRDIAIVSPRGFWSSRAGDPPEGEPPRVQELDPWGQRHPGPGVVRELKRSG